MDLFAANNPDINVELVYIPSDYSQKLQTMIAGGTAPDIMQVAEELHAYSDKGQIIALNDFVAKDNVDLKARYGETGGLTPAYSMDGNLYAMPDRGGALILDLVYKHKVAPSPEDYANLGTNSPDPLFAQGKVAMSTTGFWGIGGLKDATFNWDIAPLFKNKESATVVFGSGFAISKDSQNPEAAWKVIDFLTSEEGQTPIVEFKEDAPANIAVLNSDAFLGQSWSTNPINMTALGESADAAFALPLSPKWNEMMTIFDTNLGEVFANRAEVQPTWNLVMVGALVLTIPMILVYFFGQRFMDQLSLTGGSLGIK